MPAPSRQYVFRARRDRQRIAQRIASGMGKEAVAAVERCEVEEIGKLLGDTSFRRLVEAYEELLSASPEERRSRLVALAAEILQQEVVAGNTFACAFLLYMHEHGRDPEGTLAEAVETALIRARNGRGPNRVARESLTGPEPDPRTAEEQEAAHLAYVAERAKVQHRLARTTFNLRRRVIAEAERLGTAWAQGRLATKPIPEVLDPMGSVANEAAAVGTWLRAQERPRQDALVERFARWRAFRLGSPDVIPKPLGVPNSPSPQPSPMPAAREREPESQAPRPAPLRWDPAKASSGVYAHLAGRAHKEARRAEAGRLRQMMHTAPRSEWDTITELIVQLEQLDREALKEPYPSG